MLIRYLKIRSIFYIILNINIVFVGNSFAFDSSLEVAESGKVKINTPLHLKPQSTFPSNPENGDLVCKTDGELFVYKNGSWINIITPVQKWVEIWEGSAVSYAFNVESNTTYRCEVQWDRYKHYVLIHIGDNSEVGHSMLGAGTCNVQYNLSPKRFDGWRCTILKIEKWQ